MIKNNFFVHIYVHLSSFIQNRFRTRLQTDLYISQTNVVANVHKETFGKYKNFYNGKEIAIIATGPTLNSYKPIENIVNIGVNSAIKTDKVKLEYLFINDYTGLKKCQEDIEKHPEVKKFYGKLPERAYGLKECSARKTIIPESVILKHNASKYFLYFKVPKNPTYFNTDIDSTWMVDGGSVAISAVQFALFTNPKRIYLVGCDCSNGYFDANKPKKIKTNNIYTQSWKELKEFADLYYPDTEIVSVNPVGLRGLFTDLDQD